MKKKFIEPEIKRIELNLNENIASSNIVSSVKLFVNVAIGFDGCDASVQGTDIPFGPPILDEPYLSQLKEKECFIFDVTKTEAARMLGF